MEKKSTVQKEIKMFILLTIASVVMAFNLKSFVNTGGLFPGGFSGLTLLIQQIGSEFFHISIPYSIIYVPLNLVPAFIGLKYIGKKFTFYSFYVVFLSGFLTDLFPAVTITSDPLLISVFGGIIHGVSVSICLIAGASAGGTDFISIFLSERKGIDAWNYILAGNVVILITAGVLFSFERSMYSIIFQFCATQIIQTLYKRYQKDTLLIITEKPTEVYEKIREITHHDATLLEGMGCYEGTQRHLLYSVVGREEVDKVIKEVRHIDEGVFVNVLKTELVKGRFYKRPTK